MPHPTSKPPKANDRSSCKTWGGGRVLTRAHGDSELPGCRLALRSQSLTGSGKNLALFDNNFGVSCVQWSGEQKPQGTPGLSDSDRSSASEFGCNLIDLAVLYFDTRPNSAAGENVAMGAKIEEQ